MTIRTDYRGLAIPIRSHDWLAWNDGDEEFGPIGHGATEAEAIAALMEKIGDKSEPTLAREAQGPLRDPQECSYCEHCGKPIRQQKFLKHFAWVAEGGDMFCRTSEDRKSLIGHQPKGE